MTVSPTIEELNTVEPSVETWEYFIDASMQSEFYALVRGHSRDVELAAALTLLRSYISTFSQEEQRRIKELAPYRYKKDGYNTAVRAAFIGKIRTLLAAQKNADGSIANPDKYTFIRTLVKFCSSLGYILTVHDKYKQFLFRDLPQLKSRGALGANSAPPNLRPFPGRVNPTIATNTRIQ